MSRLLLFIFVALWSIYYLQGFAYSAGSRLAWITLLLGLLMCVYGWIKTYLTYKVPPILDATSVLLLIFSLYGFLLIISGQDIYRSFDFFQFTGDRYISSVFTSLAPVFLTYYFTRKGALKKHDLYFLFLLFFLICTARFIGYERARIFMSNYDTEGMTTNNIGYDFLALLPMVCVFRKKPIVQYILLLAVLFFTIYSVKRGAIIIALICAALLIYHNMHYKRHKILPIILGIIAVFATYYFIDHMLSSNEYFNMRFESTLEGNSSGREEYYTFFINYIKSLDSIPRLLFGGGAYYTVVLNGNLAHNDWLEILCCNGLFGVLIYLAYWACFYKSLKKSRKTYYHLPLLFLFISMLLKSFFSMTYASTPFYASFYFGYILARVHGAKNKIRVS